MKYEILSNTTTIEPTCVLMMTTICRYCLFFAARSYSDNKLATLDGRLMTQLPALHSIRLGGSNEWRCDCHLRSLVRALAAFGLGLGATSGGGSGAGGFLTSQRGASTGPAPATHAVTTDNRANRPMVMTMLELQAAAPLQLQLLQSSLVVGSLSLLEDEPECHMRATSFKPVQQHQQSENNSLATKNNMNPNEPIDSLWVSTQQRKQTWGNMSKYHDQHHKDH